MNFGGGIYAGQVQNIRTDFSQINRGLTGNVLYGFNADRYVHRPLVQGLFHAVFFQVGPEGVVTHIQEFSCLGLIVTCQFKRLHDKVFFEFFH